MKRYVKRYSCVLLVLLMLADLVSPFAYSSYDLSSEGILYEMNYSGLFPRSLLIEGNQIAVCDLPNTDSYRYVWLELIDEHGNTEYEDIIERNSNGNVFFTIPRGINGIFQLSLLCGKERYHATYTVFLDFDSVLISSGELQLSDSPAQPVNLSFTTGYQPSASAKEYYLLPSRNIQSDDESIQEVARNITSGFTDDYEKALAIHDWVCETVFYDYDVLYGRAERGNYSALDVLASHKSVCEGYANLTAALLRAVGIPARKVCGYALGITAEDRFPQDVLNGTGQTNHAWNEAFVDGRWIIMDTTWDCGNKFENGKTTSKKGCYRHRYFDISQWLLAMNHVVMEPNVYKEMYLYIGYPQYRTEEGWKPLTDDGAKPMIIDGRTLIPIRPVIEEMGGSVEWTPGTQQFLPRIVCQTNDYHAQMWPTSERLIVNGEEYTFDAVPQIIDGRTMIPLRVLLQAMGCIVKWDGYADNWNGRITIGYAK